MLHDMHRSIGVCFWGGGVGSGSKDAELLIFIYRGSFEADRWPPPPWETVEVDFAHFPDLSD